MEVIILQSLKTSLTRIFLFYSFSALPIFPLVFLPELGIANIIHQAQDQDNIQENKNVNVLQSPDTSITSLTVLPYYSQS